MKNALYCILVLVAITSCQAQRVKNIELVPPAAFAQKMAAVEGQVIDVRTPKEYQAGHIENAINMHVYDKDFEQRVDKLDKKKPVYVYCKAGGRSAEAVDLIKTKGFTSVIELDGGMDAWNEAHKPVSK
jgi:phage shock protein E